MPTIGVVSSYLSGSFLGEVYRYILSTARPQQVRILGLRLGDRERTYDTDLAVEVCDAWILLARGAHPAFIERLIREGRPVCSVGEETGVPGCGLVRSDNRQGIRSALQELSARGHRDFAFIGNPKSSDIHERLLAFQEYLEEHHWASEPERVSLSLDFGLPGGWSAAQRLHQSGCPVTAVLCGNDQNAAGALQYYQGAGVRVPQDLVLVGYDNAPLASERQFQLTTLDQQHRLLAEAAVGDVLSRLRQPERPPAQVRIPPQMFYRATFPGQGPMVPDEPPDQGQAGSPIWPGAELNRYFFGEAKSTDSILQWFRQYGRTLVHYEVQGGLLVSPDGGPAAPLEIGRLGEALLRQTQATGDFVALYPLFTEGRLDAVLLASFPWTSGLTRLAMTLDISELELMAFAVERLTNKHRLESLLQIKTEELHAARQRVIEQAQRSVTTHLAGSFAHQLNTPLGALQASARNLAELVPRLVEALGGDQPPLSAGARALLRRLSSTAPVPASNSVGRSALRSRLTTQLQAWGLPQVSKVVDLLVELGVSEIDETWRTELLVEDVERVLEIAVTQRSLAITAEVVNQASVQAAGFTRVLAETIGTDEVNLPSEKIDLGVLVGTLVSLIRASWSSAKITVNRQDPECWVTADQGVLVHALGSLLLPEVAKASTSVVLSVEVRGENKTVTVEVGSSSAPPATTLDAVRRAVERLGGQLTLQGGNPQRTTVTLDRAAR